MANRLKMALIETIQSLKQRGWSQRRIARELDIDRETVARHLKAQAAAPKPAIAPIGSAEAGANSKPPSADHAPIGSGPCDSESKPFTPPSGSATGATEPAGSVALPHPG